MEENEIKKGRLFFSRRKMNWVRIEIDLNLAEFQCAWQFNKLFVWWNAEEITDYVKDVKFICDKEGQNKYAELTVLEELLIPRSYKKLDSIVEDDE